MLACTLPDNRPMPEALVPQSLLLRLLAVHTGHSNFADEVIDVLRNNDSGKDSFWRRIYLFGSKPEAATGFLLLAGLQKP